MRSCLFCLMCAMIVGCSSETPPLENKTNSDLARETLDTALNTWQKGENFNSLTTRSPSIFINDEDWRRGKKLTKFEVGEGKLIGLGIQFPVTLSMSDSAGKATQRKVKFRVYTEPKLSIARDDA